MELKIICLVFCIALSCLVKNGNANNKTNDSQEVLSGLAKGTKCQENVGKECDIDYSNSNETGPLDSHEAMNNREFKARNKRNADVDKRVFRNMMLGLIHKKSDEIKKKEETETGTSAFQSDASELLLELMVRIAAHPQQWNEVHDLLRKIDSDIMTSKKILTDLEQAKDIISSQPVVSSTTEEPTTTIEPVENKTVGEVQRLIILLDNEEKRVKNKTDSEIWPNLGDNQINIDEEKPKNKVTTENIYPWSKPSMKSMFSKEKEFTFHRVTGKPLHYRSNMDKTTIRNAYVAVSAIGPKSKDTILEDELRQLKPWNHQDNLNRMENLRKRWFLQPDRS